MCISLPEPCTGPQECKAQRRTPLHQPLGWTLASFPFPPDLTSIRPAHQSSLPRSASDVLGASAESHGAERSDSPVSFLAAGTSLGFQADAQAWAAICHGPHIPRPPDRCRKSAPEGTRGLAFTEGWRRGREREREVFGDTGGVERSRGGFLALGSRVSDSDG